MRIRLFFLLAGLLVVHGAIAAERPNLLLIMVDEMRADAMSCAGHAIVKTPHLDRLAREGTRFATAFTVAPICTPSRYSHFSGRYAHVHGATDNDTPPREPQLLLPALLKHSGYQTALSGKLHFIPNDRAYAFDSFWSFGNEGPGLLPRWPEEVEKKNGRGSARRVVDQPFPDDPLGQDLGRLTYPKEDAQTFWITDRSLDFLRQRRADQPFFLFTSYLDPHSPSHLCEPYWNMFKADDMPLPATFHVDPNAPSRTGENRHVVNDPRIVKALTAAYYAKVAMVDDNVGRLLAGLEASGQASNTLVVFTADHGNMLGDLNRWFKGAMYEGSVRIPLIIKAPPGSPYAATFNRGRVISNIVQNIDLMPTLCEMAGVGLPAAGIQGHSLVGLVTGTDTGRAEVAYAERGCKMVRTAQYKLVLNDGHSRRHSAGDCELYDLAADPGETNNVIADPARAGVVADLKARLSAWEQDLPPAPAMAGVEMSPTGANPERPKGKRKAAGAKTEE